MDFTESPLEDKWTWYLLPSTPAGMLLATAKRFDRADCVRWAFASVTVHQRYVWLKEMFGNLS